MKSVIRRAGVLVLGLFTLAVGIGFSVAADLGVSPVSCPPYVISLWLPVSMGTASIVMQALFLAAQVMILKKDFRPVQLLQLGVLVVFGLFTDLGVALTRGIRPAGYLGQWLCLLASLPLMALGVALEIRAGLLVLPMEGMVDAVARRASRPFGQVKVIADCALVALAAALSLLAFSRLRGVREGTAAAAVLIGLLVRLIGPRLGFLDRFLGERPALLG